MRFRILESMARHYSPLASGAKTEEGTCDGADRGEEGCRPFDYSKEAGSKTRRVDADRLAELAALLDRQTDELTDDELLRAVRLADEDRDAARERVGRLLAELYQRGHLSWPRLGELTGIPYGTAHGLARPYISREDDH